MDFEALFKFATASVTIIAAVTYISKRFIDKTMDAALEKYKNTLQQDLETHKHSLSLQTENLKFQFNKISTENQIRYSKLHQERGEIIVKLYKNLIDLERDLQSLTTVWQGPDWINTNNNEEIKVKIFSFESEFEVTRLFFDVHMCTAIEELIQNMKDINSEMYKAKTQEKRNQEIEKTITSLTIEERLKPTKTWANLETIANQEIKKIRRILEREFAKLIGVEEIESNSTK